MPYFVDTETCGLHGIVVLIQWAHDDGPINLHNVWKRPLIETMELIEKITKEGIVGFNLAFDWFQIVKFYTIADLFPDKSIIPEDHIKAFAELEPFGRDGKCLKPKAALDLMLFARKGPYQSTMPRADIRIKRIPSILARQVAEELNKRIPLKPIYFAKRKVQLDNPWQVFDTKDVEFKDIVLKFAPSSALKALAVDALNIPEEDVILHDEIASPMYPKEYGFAPFAQAANILKDRSESSWPEIIQFHINHWEYHQKARKYATDDVDYTRCLYYKFGSPPLGDNDSELSCMVGAIRWKGYKVDIEGLKALREKANKKLKFCPKCETIDCDCPNKVMIPKDPGNVKTFLESVLSDDEREFLEGSTKKVILEKLEKGKQWYINCPTCNGTGCDICKGKGEVRHPVSKRASLVLEARKAKWEKDLYNKLLIAGRFHASFSVTGTLSNRMGGSGAAKGVEQSGRAKGDQLNAQGVKRTKEVRSRFPLAFPPMKLCGGDFSGFELGLAASVYDDKQFNEDLETGKQLHAIFGTFCFPGKTYEEIVKSKGQELDYYDPSKRGLFALLYAGNAKTIQERVGITIEGSEEAERQFLKRYPNFKKRREEITLSFASLRQPNGIGSKVEWHESKEYMESPLGFKRYFTLENQIRKALYDLASKPPKEWKEIKIKVIRREREQWVSGAIQSALFAAAFGLQGDITRAAVNHEIQSFGAEITKHVQRKIWDLQPVGVNDWIVQPFNIHDEIMCPTHPDYVDIVKETVNQTVESFKPKVPLIRLDWEIGLKSWADK